MSAENIRKMVWALEDGRFAIRVPDGYPGGSPVYDPNTETHIDVVIYSKEEFYEISGESPSEIRKSQERGL